MEAKAFGLMIIEDLEEELKSGKAAPEPAQEDFEERLQCKF